MNMEDPGGEDPASNKSADTSGTSDSVSTLIGSADLSMTLMDIPRDMTPYEMLVSLSNNAWIEIFTA